MKLTISKAVGAVKMRETTKNSLKELKEAFKGPGGIIGAVLILVFFYFVLYDEAMEAGYRGWFGPIRYLWDLIGVGLLILGLFVLSCIIIGAIRDWWKAPEIDIERFLFENPILGADASRECERFIINAVQFFKKNNFEAAIDEAAKAIELNPRHPRAYNIRGGAYYELRNYEEALNELQKAIELDPTFARSYYNRALVYKKLKQSQQMLTDMVKAARLGDKDAQHFLQSKGIQW